MEEMARQSLSVEEALQVSNLKREIDHELAKLSDALNANDKKNIKKCKKRLATLSESLQKFTKE
jgi:hypothetical protein